VHGMNARYKKNCLTRRGRNLGEKYPFKRSIKL
jgi:hypothetical protein